MMEPLFWHRASCTDCARCPELTVVDPLESEYETGGALARSRGYRDFSAREDTGFLCKKVEYICERIKEEWGKPNILELEPVWKSLHTVLRPVAFGEVTSRR